MSSLTGVEWAMIVLGTAVAGIGAASIAYDDGWIDQGINALQIASGLVLVAAAWSRRARRRGVGGDGANE